MTGPVPPVPVLDASRVTRLVEVARRFDHLPATATAMPPVVRASTVLFDSLAAVRAAGAAVARGEPHASTYGTSGLPTTMLLADAIAEIEGEGIGRAHPGERCRAALVPSGLAAITTAFLAFLKTGDHLLVPDHVYWPCRQFCDGMLASMGIETTYYDPRIGAGIAELIRPNTRLCHLESPGSYTFEIQDIPAITAACRARGVLTTIDNAWGSPMALAPFALGVDVSIVPLTKHWGGHADVLMGAIVARDSLWTTLWATVRGLGLCVSGDDAWLVLRGLRTAAVRVERQAQTGLEVARWLETRPEVARVLHPALPSHPDHAIFVRDFATSCGLFSFELRPEALGIPAGADAAQAREAAAAAVARLVEGRRHFGLGFSWGGFESLLMPAHLDGARSVRPWAGGPLVRVHCGLEAPADLMADLAEGLAALA